MKIVFLFWKNSRLAIQIWAQKSSIKKPVLLSIGVVG